MIKIIKPTTVPAKLTKAGVDATSDNKNAFDANPQAYFNDEIQFEISSSIYNYPTVKKALKKAQHAKCCFCEKEQHDEYGAVEHYRPKGGYKKTRKPKSETHKPGYYWLGYEWDNLYFVCGPCNTNKGALFPLTDESHRATSHHNDVNLENPYLLDPTGSEDPRNHIVFDFEFIRGKTKHGIETIKICKLDRAGLNEKRKKLISDIEFHIGILVNKAIHPAETVNKSRLFILNCSKPQAEFSAMAMDYLSKFNIQQPTS